MHTNVKLSVVLLKHTSFFVFCAGNDFVIPVQGAEMEVSRVALRIHKELVKPLRELDITDKEFTCLRTIVFFTPGQSLNTSSVLCRHKHGYCQEHLASFFQSVQTTWFHNGRWEHINVGLLWFCWQINCCMSFEPSTLLMERIWWLEQLNWH